jgi:purine-binding chemotaxis protein CheW
MLINVFDLAGIFYAIPLSQTRELVRMPSLIPLPQAPPVIEGIVDLRGATIAVFDMRKRFRLPPRPPLPSDILLVAEAAGRRVGLRVDRVLGIEEARPGEIEQAAAVAAGTDYLAGIVRLSQGLVLIHDLATFLDAAESDALDVVMQRLPETAS